MVKRSPRSDRLPKKSSQATDKIVAALKSFPDCRLVCQPGEVLTKLKLRGVINEGELGKALRRLKKQNVISYEEKDGKVIYTLLSW